MSFKAPWDTELALIDEFSVRLPRTSDLPRIHEIYLDSWKAIYGDWNLGWSDAKILQEFHMDRHPLSSWLVVEHDEKIVGFLRHSTCLRKLDKIFVARNYWRTGAGYALIRAYLWKVARKYSDPVTLHLEVFTGTPRAHRFFGYFSYYYTGISYVATTSKREVQILAMDFKPLKDS